MKESIQGKNVVIAFKKDTYVPFVCASDMTLDIDADTVEVRTAGDGQWKKKAYQALSWTLSISGVMVFDDDNFDTWEMLGNQLSLLEIDLQATFEDDASPTNIRSIRGTALIIKNSISFTVSDVVKSSHSLEGNGSLIMFNGNVPCPGSIENIVIDGQEAADGIVHVTYDFIGPVYQVKYLVDATGDYVYALVGQTIDIQGLHIGTHSIELIPVCINGFQGDGTDTIFEVTRSLTCDSEISVISVDTTAFTATNTHTGSATQMRYRLDGGAWINSPIDSTVSLAGMSTGAHTIEEVPICANGVLGTGTTQNFTITVQPSQTAITYGFNTFYPPSVPLFRIFANGVLLVSENVSASGDISVAVGTTLLCVIQAVDTAHPTNNTSVSLTITDTTTSTVLYDHTQVAPGNNSLNFSFVTDSDSISIGMATA